MAASSSATAEALDSSTSACNLPAADRQEPIDHPNGRPSLPHVRHNEVTDSSANSVSGVPALPAAPSDKPSASWLSSLRVIRAVTCLTQCWAGPSAAALDDTVTDSSSATT